MSTDGEDIPKRDRIKRHLKENKKVYLAAVGGAAVGAAGMVIVCGVPGQIVDSFKLVHIQYKSPNVNIALVKQACPEPIPVLDKQTGEAYASIRRAMKATGKNFYDISKDAQGAQERFEQLPYSVFA